MNTFFTNLIGSANPISGWSSVAKLIAIGAFVSIIFGFIALWRYGIIQNTKRQIELESLRASNKNHELAKLSRDAAEQLMGDCGIEKACKINQNTVKKARSNYLKRVV